MAKLLLTVYVTKRRKYMAFSIKIIDLGAVLGNPSIFSPDELAQIQLAANDWASLLSNNDFADLSGVFFQVKNGQGIAQNVVVNLVVMMLLFLLIKGR
jgi:hypothetical protein